MVDSKFFNIPFATSGDKATIPEPVQPGGGISYTQGFGPDYERDPTSDPLAKRVPRDETNEYLYQITNSLKFLQLYGLPEWYAPASGPANYPISARVRYDAGAGMQAWISLVATNTAVPGSDDTKWALDEFFNLPALEATAAEAIAGTIGTKIITPRRLASAVQRNPWTYAAAGGTANVLTLTLAPAPAALSVGMKVGFKAANTSTAAATLNVNGLGAIPLAPATFRLKAGNTYEAIYDGANWNLLGVNAGDAVLSALSRLTYTGAPVVPDDTITTAPISTFTDDGQADWSRSGNTLTCLRAGRYQVLANFGVGLGGGVYVSALTLGMRKNGSEFFSSSLRLGSAVINQMFSGASDVSDFAAGDTMDGWVYQQSGASRTVPMVSRVSFLRLTSS